jgi:hypothetical protein
MDDKTTTDAPVDDQAADQPQPESTEAAPAEPTPAEPPEQSDEQPAEPSPDDTSEWLQKKGIDPTDPEALTKLAKSAREAEKAMHRNAQKASELEKAMDNGITEEAEAQGLSDDERLDIVRIKTKLSVREFFDGNPEARQYEAAMIEELQRKPHLAGDLESLYANAVLKSGSLDNVKSQGKREALESLAHKQQAAVPKGSAVNSQSMGSQQITPDNVDLLVAQNGYEWYRKNVDAVNKAMSDRG